MYWLRVLYGSEFITKEQFDDLMSDLNEMYKIISASVKTAKAGL
jgi:four helix bundle protein